jgi:hypothetical protein
MNDRGLRAANSSLRANNNGATPEAPALTPDATLIHLIALQVQRSPGATAVVFEGETLSYAQ